MGGGGVIYYYCEHSVKGDVFGELTCFRCGLRFGNVFSECEHRRKERFFDYSDFYCCADCGYHLVDGDPKYRHPNQYENCEHSHKEKINDQLTCLRCGIRLSGPPLPPFLKYSEYYKICKHLCLDDINGKIYCIDCGHIDRVELISEHNENFDHHTIKINHCKSTKRKPAKKDLTEYSKAKELRKAATKLGVKCTTIMSKKQLCEVSGIKISNEGKHILKNTKTGEKHKFKTLKEISTKFNICLGLISYYMGKNITIGENTFSLEKL